MRFNLSMSTIILISTVALKTLVAGLPQVSAIRDIGPSCDGKDPGTRFTYTFSSVYDITHGDYLLYGDLRSSQVGVLQDYIATSDSGNSCGSLSFTNVICYVKTSAPAAVANSNIWAAEKLNAKRVLTCVDEVDHGKMYQASKGQF